MATLKISDLSVGDWVRVINQFDAQIDGYHSGSGSLSLKTRQGNLVHYRLEDIHFIPITAELLEKNGFARGKRGNFYHYLLLDKNRTLYIHASTNGWRVQITYDAAGILRTTHLMPDMNSVHQLQHALRLAGVDKEINL
jgi:hypothetical protein